MIERIKIFIKEHKKINKRAKKLSKKKQMKYFLILLLQNFWIVLPFIVVCILLIYGLVFLNSRLNFKLPITFMINCIALANLIIFFLISLRLISPQKNIRILENLEKEK